MLLIGKMDFAKQRTLALQLQGIGEKLFSHVHVGDPHVQV